ncbi:DNA alkylation repair protein [Sphingomonas sp. LB-2]|uniref:DNA alkylation repair protein n=1 Tax=Sphingomonas caeni TaxID=2984949 RepID=UPI00222FB0A0|nr:DNA alkylation repair protein [Sphingomonas caeni]MCW3846460.1 DNA alkylation repair protein [Sphingomonas caeni]
MTGAAELIAELEAHADPASVDGLKRYGIVTADRVLGMSVNTIRQIAKPHRKQHGLALQLWEAGIYEARFLAVMVDDPAEVTPEQMDHWRSGFDNWATCDTACFDLFDRTPHAFAAIDRWAPLKGEFDRRASFALLASVALHLKKLPDQPFLDRLPLIEAAAADPRNFVKKGVSWALRGVGRRSPALHAASMALSERLAGSKIASERWIGKDALKDLSNPKLLAKLRP